MTALTKSLKKLAQIGRAASGVLEDAIDIDLAYLNYAGLTEDEHDGTGVAIVDAPANDLAVPVDASGNILASTAPLGTTVLTTTAAKTRGYGRIVGTIFSDVSGTLLTEQSNDGQHWDATNGSDSVTGGTGLSFSHEVVALYVRFVFTPGTSNGVLRFYPLLRRLGSA